MRDGKWMQKDIHPRNPSQLCVFLILVPNESREPLKNSPFVMSFFSIELQNEDTGEALQLEDMGHVAPGSTLLHVKATLQCVEDGTIKETVVIHYKQDNPHYPPSILWTRYALRVDKYIYKDWSPLLGIWKNLFDSIYMALFLDRRHFLNNWAPWALANDPLCGNSKHVE